MYLKLPKMFRKKPKKIDEPLPLPLPEPKQLQKTRTKDSHLRKPTVPLAQRDFPEPAAAPFEPSYLLTSTEWPTIPSTLPASLRFIPRNQRILADYPDRMASCRRKINVVHHHSDQLTDYVRPKTHCWSQLRKTRTGEQTRSKGDSLVDEGAMRAASRAHQASQGVVSPAISAPTLDAQNHQAPLRIPLVPRKEVQIVLNSVPEEDCVRERNRINQTPYRKPRTPEEARREYMYLKMRLAARGEQLLSAVEKRMRQEFDDVDQLESAEWVTEKGESVEEEVKVVRKNKGKVKAKMTSRKGKERAEENVEYVDAMSGEMEFDAVSTAGEEKHDVDSLSGETLVGMEIVIEKTRIGADSVRGETTHGVDSVRGETTHGADSVVEETTHGVDNVLGETNRGADSVVGETTHDANNVVRATSRGADSAVGSMNDNTNHAESSTTNKDPEGSNEAMPEMEYDGCEEWEDLPSSTLYEDI